VRKCPFCKIEKEKIIYENKYFRVILDEFPVSPGHALIIPKRHCVSLLDLTKSEFSFLKSTLEKTLEKIKRINLRSAYKKMLKNPLNEKSQKFLKAILKSPYLGKDPDGFNFGVNEGKAAGKTVEHLHFHLIPRYFGDVKNPMGGVRNIFKRKGDYRG